MGSLEKRPIRRLLQATRAMAVGVSLLALAGCSTTKPVPPPVASFCDLNQPFRPTEASLAVMSQEEVDEGLAHNLRGELLCGWKA